MKGDSIYIDHIKNSIDRILGYIENLDRSTFLTDHKTQDAVVRQFEIIGEATKRVSPEFRDNNPLIPWEDMAGMRDVLIHDYIEVDFEIVWKTATEHLPQLKNNLSNLS